MLDCPKPKRGRLLSPAQLADFDDIVHAGPDMAVDGVVRWRRIDLKQVVERRFGVVMAERTIGDLLHERGFRHLSMRPRHPRCDEAVQDIRHIFAYLHGALCSERGVGAGLVMPKADAEGLNDHLAEIARAVMPGPHAVLILDSAGWHKSKDLTISDDMSLLKLPAYAPELNPVENRWQFLRRNKLAHRLYNTYGAITDACCNARNLLMAAPERIISTGARDWATVS